MTNKDLIKTNVVIDQEKDLNNAAKKLEKAIEELNKEARNRIINTFTKINNTFSVGDDRDTPIYLAGGDFNGDKILKISFGKKKHYLVKII